MKTYYITAKTKTGGYRIVGEAFGKADANAELRRWQARYPRATFRLETD